MVFITNNKKQEKIDLIDKKIITYLRYDAQISRKKLAKELNIGESNLNYKIQRLQEKNIINPILLINFRNLGFKHYNILMDKLNKEDLEKISKSDEISVILEVFGSKKIILEIITKNLEQFLKKHIPNERVDIMELLDDKFYLANPFELKLNSKLLSIKNNKNISENYKLNKIEAKILLTLSKNSLLTILGISKETGLNRQTVKKYIEKLYESNIIYKSIFGVNVFTIGFEEYWIKISTVSHFKENILKELSQNQYINISSNSFQDIISYVQVPNYHILAKTIENIEKISHTIKVECFQILNTIKINNLPKIVEKELEQIK